TLAVGSAGGFRLRGARTGEVTRHWSGHKQTEYVAYSRDGKTLTWGTYRHSVFALDAGAGEPRQLITPPKGVLSVPGFVMALSPDGKTLLSGHKGEPFRFRDVATGRELHRLAAPEEGLRAVAFLPDGKALVSLNLDQTVSTWDAASG